MKLYKYTINIYIFFCIYNFEYSEKFSMLYKENRALKWKIQALAIEAGSGKLDCLSETDLPKAVLSSGTWVPFTFPAHLNTKSGMNLNTIYSKENYKTHWYW